MQKEIEKKSFVFEMNGSKNDFCNSITFTVITQDDKDSLINIESVPRPTCYVACQDVL